MTLKEMRDLITSIINDSEYTSTIIDAFINEGVLAVATGVMLPGRFDLSPPLPSLYKTDTVATDANNNADLPSDYNRDVVKVSDSDGNKITIEPSFMKFTNETKSEAGTISLVSIHGDKLYYDRVPSSPATLTVGYYSNPSTLTDDGDIPTEIPLVLHRQLIVGYALKEIYNEIELGMAGQKVDTRNYEAIFNQGLVRLQQLIPEDALPNYYEESPNDSYRTGRI